MLPISSLRRLPLPRRFSKFHRGRGNDDYAVASVAPRPRADVVPLCEQEHGSASGDGGFVLVVDTGSFSAAARRLNVGQPAVSKLVAQLEERLGVKLLVRTTRGLTATEAGLNYYERARRSIEEADEAELAARGAGSSLTSRISGIRNVVLGVDPIRRASDGRAAR